MDTDSKIITYLENWRDQAGTYFQEYDTAEAMHEHEVLTQVIDRLKAGDYLTPVSEQIHWQVEN